MPNFDFWGKDLRLVSPTHFMDDLSTKIFLMLYSISFPNFIVWLSLLFEVLGNFCTELLKLTLTFSSSRFPTWPKQSEQKFKYVPNEQSFSWEIKIIKWLLVARNCLRTKSSPLINTE